ncbi:MAG: DNA/RNA non-specific endonuclease [Oligoflexus sp.]|nr:DNA/RNA non-specific endonuclease [Oligoflexus sp.]
MLKLISFAFLLTTLACQSGGYNLRLPGHSGRPDKSPGPIVVPANADAAGAGSAMPPYTPSDTPKAGEGGIEPTTPEMGALPGSNSEVSDQQEIKSVAKPVFIGEADPTKNKNLPYGLVTLTSSAENWIISRPQYVLSWNKKTRNINWVAWLMNLDQLVIMGRQKTFVADPDLKEYVSETDVKPVTTADYSGTCFDRGHQVASSDRQANQEDNAATFYMTNIIPQVSFLNQVIWRKLEIEIQDWIVKGTYKNLWVVAGPIYDNKPSYIGPDQNIAVPKSNFKAVFAWDDMSRDKPYLVKAVIMPNVLSNGAAPLSDETRRCKEQANGGRIKGDVTQSEKVDDYLATIPAIEAASYLKFPAVVRP